MIDRKELIEKLQLAARLHAVGTDDECERHFILVSINKAIEALSDQWISVDEKPIELPCFIYWSDGGVESYTADFCIDDLTACCDAIDGYHATHWMPLPELPED